MQKYLVLASLCVFGSIILVYLVQNLDPFNQDKIAELIQFQEIKFQEELNTAIADLRSRGLLVDYLNMRHVGLIYLVAALSVGSAVILTHVALEKIVTRRFYAPANLQMAVRRSAWVVLGLAILLFYRLFAVDNYVVLLTAILIVIMEFMITKAMQKPTPA